MVPSPALVPSPSPQHPMMAGPQRSVGMAPSPSSSLNTPGGVGATPSPQEDQAYRDKIRQLNRYIEPLRRMITKMGNEGSKSYIMIHKVLRMPVSKTEMDTADCFFKCPSSNWFLMGWVLTISLSQDSIFKKELVVSISDRKQNV